MPVLGSHVQFEHFSTTVPDIEQAVRFFVDVLGAVDDGVRHRFSGPDADFDMASTFNAHPDAVAHLVRLQLHGVTYELFQYESPDLDSSARRNCDVGGHHLGLRVRDLDAAIAALRSVAGVRVLGEANWSDTKDFRRGWVYFLTPWGMQMELAEQTALS